MCGIITVIKAPGVLKLLGEHAVVYGYLSVAIGIDRHAKATKFKARDDALHIGFPTVNMHGKLSYGELSEIYKQYKSRKDIASYINDSEIDRDLLPFATIAARLACEFGIEVTRQSVTLYSDIPMQKGMASSAALSTAFTLSLVSGRKWIGDDNIIDVARDGERIIHRNDNAGRIDVSTSYYGGYTMFGSKVGAKNIKSKTRINLLVIDTGPKKSTAQTVGHVAQLYKNDMKTTSKILKSINECSLNGVKAIKEGNIGELGRLMYLDHNLLRDLGVSSKGLDSAVSICKDSGALGAKLSGGGGGGIAIAILKKSGIKTAMSRLKKKGFRPFQVKIDYSGAKKYLRR